ncbi:chain length determinant protein, partial [Streptomyces sp. TRM76130]|nr:chain length determinant protein [Streptomyces sp. TRM76130]
MDLAEIVRVMRRRWYVLLPGLLLTAGLLAVVAVLVPVSYQSQSTVLLLNSAKATADYDGNPFLSTQTSLTGMADSLARSLTSDDSLRELESRGAEGTFETKLADNAQGPLLWLTVTGTDAGS